MKDDLASFELSKLAFEKGFERNPNLTYPHWLEVDIDTDAGTKSVKLIENDFLSSNSTNPVYYEALTHSLIKKWLRINHNTHMWVIPRSLKLFEGFYFKDGGYTFSLNYKSYEEAMDKTLIYCCNLIELKMKEIKSWHKRKI